MPESSGPQLTAVRYYDAEKLASWGTDFCPKSVQDLLRGVCVQCTAALHLDSEKGMSHLDSGKYLLLVHSSVRTAAGIAGLWDLGWTQ